MSSFSARRTRTWSAVLAAAALFAPRQASAALRMKWDCYLPNTGLDCVVLEASLIGKVPFLRTVSQRRDADVAVTVSSVPTENGTRFLFHFEGQPREGYGIDVHTVDKIPSTIDATTATVRIMTRLERGLAEFMDQKIAAEVKNGALAIQLLDPTHLPFSGRSEQQGVKWYLAPSVGTYFSDVEGVGVNASGTASVSYNYSGARFRAQQWIGVNYTQQSQPVAGTNETASISFLGMNANTVLSRSLSRDNRWNAGILLAAEKNPQANFRMRANGSAGLEFDLIPRQTVNMRNLGFRCAVGPEYEHYDAVNVEGIDQQMVARQFCDVFLSWHFVPVDLWANLSETSVLKSIDYRSFAVGLSAAWRVTENLTIAPWVNLQEINKAINAAEPNTVAYTDPRQEVEASMAAAIEQGYTAPFGIQSGVSVRFLVGNGSLNSEDQRWRGASNLR
ncbi:MAG TPA: hypothetical protein VGI39_32975 [Polyangiaceae bacterium]|jgi:hypothetical protein